MKVKREKSHRLRLFLVEGLIVAWGKFCAGLVILRRKVQLTFTLNSSHKIWFSCRLFRVTNQANYQDYSGMFNWGRHCIRWSYTRTRMFFYLRNTFGHGKLLTSRKPLSKYRKIPKICPGLIFFKGPFWGTNIRKGNLRLKIDWASSLIVERKFMSVICSMFLVKLALSA